jgi:hypothetical protein
MNTMRKLINRISDSKEIAKAKYKTLLRGSTEKPFDMLEGDRNNIEWMMKYAEIYNRGGLVTSAINLYPEYILKAVMDQGIEFTGRKAIEEQTDYLTDWVDSFDFVNVLNLLIINSLVSGRGIAEIVHSRDGEAPLFLHPRDPNDFEIETDMRGIITNYVQTLSDSFGKKETKTVKSQFILDLRLLSSNNILFGNSLIGSAFDDIHRDAKTAEGTSKGIWRHGTRKYDITVGDIDDDVDDDALEEVAETFSKIDSMKEIVHRADVEIKELDGAGIPVMEYNETSITRMFGALGVPSDLILIKGSSMAVSDKTPQFTAFQNKISAIQTKLNYQLWTQLFKPVLEYRFGEGNVNPVFIKFGDIDVDDMLARSQISANMRGKMDTFEIYSEDEIRAVTGHPARMEEREEEDRKIEAQSQKIIDDLKED